MVGVDRVVALGVQYDLQIRQFMAISIKSRTNKPLPAEMPSWGVAVVESHHGVDFRMKPVKSDYLKVFSFFAGAGRLETDRSNEVEAGDVGWVPIGQNHHLSDDAQRPMSLHVVCIRASVWACEPGLLDGQGFGVLPRDAGLSSQVSQRIRALLVEQTRGGLGCASAMTAMGLELLAMLARYTRETARPGQTPSDRVRSYITRMERTFFEPMVLDEAAAMTGMSRRYFTRLFREITGMSWLDYLRMLRVNHARTLLRDTDRSVSSIAFECGFDDLSTFYRVFGRASKLGPTSANHKGGISPKKYREEVRRQVSD